MSWKNDVSFALDILKNDVAKTRHNAAEAVNAVNRTSKEIINELSTLKDSVNNTINSLQKDLDDIRQWISGHTCEENIYLQRANDALMQIISQKYDKGTIIFYDERNPREITVVRDGKKVDMDKATELSFWWGLDEFPTLEITR